MNKIERLKQELLPFEFKLENLDFYNLSESDRFYLKNFGIYNIKLRPEVFMIRIRFDGLNIPDEHLKIILEIAKEFNLSIILTARGGLELHKIDPKDLLFIYKKIQKSGIKTHQTLTDNFRSIVTDPLCDLEEDLGFNTQKIIASIRDFFLDNKEFFGTIPRKFNTAIISTKTPIDSFWGNDALFGLAKKENRLGFNLYLGGKNSEVAKSADIFILPEDIKNLFIAIARVFNEDGLRGSRSKTRMFHLIEKIGMESLREKIEIKFGSKLQRAGELLLKRKLRKIESLKIKDNLFIEKVESKYGEIKLTLLEKILELKDVTIRFGIDQNIYLISKKPINLKESRKNLQITACVGARYCPLSLWDIKEDVDFLPIKRLKKLNIKVGFSGCLKGCGRHYHSDIGLIGLRTNLYAPTEKAFRVFLGAIYDTTPARMLYYSVPKRSFNSLLETILDDFETSKEKSFVDFSQKVLSKYSIETLQLWFLLKGLGEIQEDLQKLFLSGNEEFLLETLEKKFQINLKNLNETIRKLSHELWDIKE
jgi:ferredoxin-nitrite reductase